MYLLCIFLPVVTALFVLFPPSRNIALKGFFPLAALPAVFAGLFPMAAGMEISSLILNMQLGLSKYGNAFLFPTALVWFASSLFARKYMAPKDRFTSFAFFFLLTMSGNFGLILAQDLPSFYTFFALMTYAAYGLIVHDRTSETYRAANTYLVMALLGEAAVITAVFLAVSSAPGLGIQDIIPAIQTSSRREIILAAAFIGFGVKAGAFLLHFWLPLAHPAAPAPASAVLSGCMIKAGLLGWLHFFPAGTMDFPFWGSLFIWFGLIALFYGVFIGLLRLTPKTILAYSSISQMGLMTLTLGIGLRDASLWPVVLPVLLILVVNHALSKGVLFLAAGTAPYTGAGGLSGRMLLAGAFLPLLALAGFPWTAGAGAKYGLKQAVVSSSFSWPLDPALILTLSALATTLLLGHFLIRLVETMEPEPKKPGAGLWLPWAMLLPFIGAAMPMAHNLIGMKTSVAAMTHYDPWSMAWPVLAGLALAIPYRYFCAQCVLPYIVPWRTALESTRPVLRIAQWGLHHLERLKTWSIRLFWVQYVRLFDEKEDSPRVFKWIEQRFMHWHTAGLLFVFLLVTFMVLILIREWP